MTRMATGACNCNCSLRPHDAGVVNPRVWIRVRVRVRVGLRVKVRVGLRVGLRVKVRVESNIGKKERK